MLTVFCSSLAKPLPFSTWKAGTFRLLVQPRRVVVTVRFSSAPSSSPGEDSVPTGYDPSVDLLGLDVEHKNRTLISDTAKLRSWFGPNGQYIRELPCPSCRGRGYTPCKECGIERSRVDCSECNGKGIKTCNQCSGDRVIWEESIDERPWEKARSSSPFKVKEDDEVDKLEIKVDATRRSKRVYQSLSPEVGLKISRSLRILNAKTGLFSNHMKMLHSDPRLHAQRVESIKKAKGTPAARKQASDTMKAYFNNPENRIKRSITMKGVKFHCSNCGKEGHRKHYCPSLQAAQIGRRFQCRLCGKRGHNRRTCGRVNPEVDAEKGTGSRYKQCKLCSHVGHNRRTCPRRDLLRMSGSTANEENEASTDLPSKPIRKRSCRLCLKKGHNIRTCPDRERQQGR